MKRSLSLLVAAAFVLLCAAPGADAKLVFQRQGQVWVAADGGQRPRLLGPGTQPAISPDGRWVAMLRHRSPINATYELYVRPVARGGHLRRVARQVDSILWDPQSRVIVSFDQAALRKTDVRRGRSVFFTSGTRFEDCGESFAPDGRLAYTARAMSVFPKSLPFEGDRELTSAADGACDPLWGPRGLAYDTLLGDGVNEPFHGETIQFIPNGGVTHTLLSPGGSPVAWSKDGATLLVRAAGPPEARTQPALIDIGSGTVRWVPGTGIPVDLAPDASSILLQQPDGLHAIHADGSHDRLVAAHATYGSWNP